MYYSMYIKQYLIKVINVSSCHSPPSYSVFTVFTRILKIMNHQETKWILYLSSWQLRPKLFHNYLFSQFTEYATTVYTCLCPIQCSSHHHPHHHSVCFCIILFSNRVTIKMLQGWGYVSSSFSPALYQCITWSNKLPGCMNTYSSWVVGEIC